MRDKRPAGKGTITVSYPSVLFSQKSCYCICKLNFRVKKALFLLFLQLCAEERTDSRVVEFEVAARKLDKKVVAAVHSGYAIEETACTISGNDLTSV